MSDLDTPFEKQGVLKTYALQKSPIKIKNYTLNNKYGTNDVVIGRRTTITPTVVDFPYRCLDTVMTIGSLTQVAAEQLVAVKGKIAQLCASKTIVLGGQPVKKQEGCIVDPSGFIKVIFWGSHVDSVHQDATYIFNKLRLKSVRGERYLNTPKSEDDCKIIDSEPFTAELPAVDNALNSRTAVGEITGIFSAERYKTCRTCTKKVIDVDESLVKCERCQLTMKSSRCDNSWFLRICVETEETHETKDSKDSFRLAVYNDAALKFIEICDVEVHVDSKLFATKLLSLDPMKFTYDPQNNTVIDVEKIDI